jgi:hypothetical protein
MLIVLKSGSHNFLESSGPLQVCTGVALSLPTLCATISAFSIKQSKPMFRGGLQLTYSEMSATRKMFMQQVQTTAEYFLLQEMRAIPSLYLVLGLMK